ncbi:MAG: DUF2905 domain-containing protein [bacterium]
METIGKFLIAAGIIIAIVGFGIIILNKVHIPIGKLPGDIIIRKKNFTFYFPLMTSILISIIISLIIYFITKK